MKYSVIALLFCFVGISCEQIEEEKNYGYKEDLGYGVGDLVRIVVDDRRGQVIDIVDRRRSGVTWGKEYRIEVSVPVTTGLDHDEPYVEMYFAPFELEAWIDNGKRAARNTGWEEPN